MAVHPHPVGCGGERTDTPAARLSEVRAAARHSRARHDRGRSTRGAAAVHGDNRVPNAHEGGCFRRHRGGSVGGAEGGDLQAAAAPGRLQWKLSDSHLFFAALLEHIGSSKLSQWLTTNAAPPRRSSWKRSCPRSRRDTVPAAMSPFLFVDISTAAIWFCPCIDVSFVVTRIMRHFGEDDASTLDDAST